MKILENMDLCYGCAACANICPKAAISMEPAKDGFLYPVIDQEACVNCGACQKVCPQLNAQYENDREPKVHAVMANDEIREKSASGGVFSLLAEYAFAQDGYVVGAAFADDFRSVHHEMIHDRKDLDRLRRSKYVQSENGDIYKQVKEKLDQDAFVLFVGTPCQCAALKSFLRKPYEKLLVVDLICRGTPSPLAWNKFLDEIAPGKPIKDVNFRYKGLQGWSETTHVEFQNLKEYTEQFKDCNFEQASSKNLISRKSCGTCQFARVPRQGDLTIGDYWGVHLMNRNLDDRKGTSAVIINSEKGRLVFETLQKSSGCKLTKEMPFVKSFMRNNANVVYRFPQTHPGRQMFFDAMEEGLPFSEALNRSKGTKYDIMLFSIWYAANFGSMMTNFALYKYLEDMGYNCIFADIPDHLWPTSIVHRNPLFITRRFGYKHFKITDKYKNRTDLKKVNNLADTFIVGSDQIWNYKLCKSAETFFYLDFVDEDKKKIAYGTSFGHGSFRGTTEERKTAGFYLNRFDAVSVREDYAVDLCKDAFGVDAVQVLDPVFMCNKAHYLNCVGESRLNRKPPENKYLLAYVLDPTEEKQQVLEESAKQLGLDLICIPNAQVKDDLRAKWRLPIVENIDMEDWLWYFKNAEQVITDSFHGVCFSIIFEKKFVAIGNKRRGLERFYSLLSGLGLQDRLVLSPEEIQKKQLIHASMIDYAQVNGKIDALRAQSGAWLKEALASPKRPESYSAYDIADRRIDQVMKLINDKEAALTKKITEQNKLIETQKKLINDLQNKQIQPVQSQENQLPVAAEKANSTTKQENVVKEKNNKDNYVIKTLKRGKRWIKKCAVKMHLINSPQAPKNEEKKPVNKPEKTEQAKTVPSAAKTASAKPAVIQSKPAADDKKEPANVQKSLLEANPDFVKIRILATLLRDYGIKHVVLSPGGRDVPIIRMFEYNEAHFTLHRITDERSAAYYAMGIAAQLQQPVACVCTSGTAASNYLPAVTEAFYTGVPLIVITADRREVYLNHGEDQTIPQKNIYRDVVKKEVSLPEGGGTQAEYQTRRDISDCILESTHNGFGPVHINISIENINIGSDASKEEWKLLPKIEPHLLRVDMHDGGKRMMKWVESLKKAKRILLVYGQNAYPTEKQRQNIEKFASKFNCVIVTDHISNLNCAYAMKPHNMLLNMTGKQFNDELTPDILITVGGKRLMNDPLTGKIRKGSKAIRHWSVTPDGKVRDFYFKLTSVLEMSQDYFFEWFANHAGDIVNDGIYFDKWKQLNEKYEAPVVETYTSNYIQSKFLPAIPANSLLHLGVGQSFYDCRKYPIDKTVDVFCNMGTNGIDGCTSTFMGQCAVEKEKLCFLLVGDLSFFYDMNSIWNKKLDKNVRILMVNNNGTGLLRRHKLKAVSSVHNTEARGWVESTGFDYICARSRAEFETKLAYFVSEKPQKALFFEVFCD